jgi:HAD superfamily hydrolase (TIGR01509 family)
MSRRAPSPDPAVVFDLDGVLLESEIAWTRAEADLFARYGQPYGDVERRLLIGGSLADTGRTLERLLEGVRTSDQLVEELVELAAVEFARGVTPMPGAPELIDELRGRRPIAVASNSLRRLVDLALDGSGLNGAFDAVIAGDEVPQPKPAPDIYLEAARRLGSPPERAVAIEDSPTGAAAARAAGMFVIGIPYLHDLVLDVDLVGRSLEDNDVRAVLGLPPLGEH